MKKCLFTVFTVFTSLCLLAAASQAQTVWRCGPEGRSYADSPCDRGRAIEVTAGRPAADLQQAQSNARREQALAMQLANERRQREGLALSAPAGIRGSRLAAAPVTSKAKAAAKSKHRLEASETWQATVPASRRGRD